MLLNVKQGVLHGGGEKQDGLAQGALAKPNPKAKSKTSRKLTPAQKTAAKSRAKKAGRPYPNLVDNMAVAKKANARKRKA